MKLCLSCQNAITTSHWQCQGCNFTPEIIDNFLCFSPALANSNEHYDPKFFAELKKLEENHFWFVARNKLISWAIKSFFSKAANFLEIGCGTGYLLSGLKKDFPNIQFTGSEIYVQGLEVASARLPE